MSFLRTYSEYAERLTDAPPLFHHWTGVSLLAAALGNRCWVWAWGRRICPNVWIVLLADSGVLRKTTSLNIGKSIIVEHLPQVIWPSEWSFEALVATMAARPAGALFVGEFKRLNAALLRDYAGGAKELLVDTYDNPDAETRRTKKEGESAIRFPAPTLLAATTRDWFEASLQREDVGGGFLSRLYIIPARERGEWKGIGSSRSDSDRIVRESLGEHLKSLKEAMNGELEIAPIQQRFNEWLCEYEASWTGRSTPELNGTISRSGANVLKLAAIFQADMAPSNTLTLDSFERARESIEFLNEQTAQLLADGLGLGPDAKERRRVLEAIRKAYPDVLPHSDALRNLNLSARSLERHVSTLVQADLIRVEAVNTTTRTGKGYRCLNGTQP